MSRHGWYVSALNPANAATQKSTGGDGKNVPHHRDAVMQKEKPPPQRHAESLFEYSLIYA